MRVTGVLLVAGLFFIGGLFWGLMYEPTEKESQEQVDMEEVQMVDLSEEVEVELASIQPVKDHPIEKVASIFENVTTYIFDKIIRLLYALAEIWF